ncbi:MAG: ATP-binding cassette domain-containing protein, partial [Deltaproteobacteria bacterium]|nr:ATP-binding cassette domain-containing protein [Deltaproteobacteria bacterium]
GLDDEQSLQHNVAGDRSHVQFQGKSVDIRSYLKRFLFEPHRARDRVAALSGGERARAALAKMLLLPANVLLLDEPTNDLDVSTLATLEEMLVEGESTALIVCHDRYFLDRVATGILAFEDEGQVTAYAGNYSDYREARAERDATRERTRPVAGKAEKRRSEPKPRKLSYKEKMELEEIVISDPATYAERASEVPSIVERQRKGQEELEQLMSRWMELEAISAD